MSKHPKKGQVTPANLFVLGAKNKNRPISATLASSKKPKTDELSPSSFLSSFDQSKIENGNLETLIINYINSIKSSLIISSKTGKIIPSQGLGLYIACKRSPTLFTRTPVIDCICNVLSYTGKESIKESNTSYIKPQSSTSGVSQATKLKQLHILLTYVLYSSLKDNTKWPVSLVKAYLEDCFGERNWVDLPESSVLVQNIETAFPVPGLDVKTFYPPTSPSENLMAILENAKSELDCSKDPIDNINMLLTGYDSSHHVRPRFEQSKTSIDALVANILKDMLERKYMNDAQTRSVIRTLCSLAALSDVRGSIVNKIDSWLGQAKSQSATMNLLKIMSNSCYQSIAHSQQDVNFCVQLMLKLKYKLYKPNIQTTLLECVRRIVEMHPSNLRHLLSIYVNNELYGVPVVNLSASHTAIANKTSTLSISFPAIYYLQPSEAIKILSDLVHEQLCSSSSDIRSVRLLLRDMCRCLRTAHNTISGSIYQSFSFGTNCYALPESLELQDLAQNLLSSERLSSDTASASFLARISEPGFKKSYVENMVLLVTDLQLLSTIKPSVRDSIKAKYEKDRKAIDVDALQQHYNTLRQIRFYTCKWIKNIYRHVESHISADQMTHHLRQVLFLNITRHNDFTYTVDESYGLSDVWSNETDKGLLVRGLTEIPISEKQMNTLLSLAADPSLACFRAPDLVEALSELVVRASASGSADIVAMHINRGENIVGGMFSCCHYEATDTSSVPSEPELAFKAAFWRVCQALVVLASHCPESCGSILWEHYPTVRSLMQAVITNSLDGLVGDREGQAQETKLVEAEIKLILATENRLLDPSSGMVMSLVDIHNSRLLELLMANSPRGPVRLPSVAVVDGMRSVFSHLQTGDRLSHSRQPDFLLHIVRDTAPATVHHSRRRRRWIADLVKKTGLDNIATLPLLCLTEFVFSELCDKYTGTAVVATVSSTDDSCLKRIVTKIRSCFRERTDPGTDNNNHSDDRSIVSAITFSFLRRFSDPSGFVRKVARECLYLTMRAPDEDLESMRALSDLAESLEAVSVGGPCSGVVDAIRAAVIYETDWQVLQTFISWLVHLVNSNEQLWAVSVTQSIAELLTGRPILAEQLRESESAPSDMTAIVSAYLTIGGSSQQQIQLEGGVVLKESGTWVGARVLHSMLVLLSWGTGDWLVGDGACLLPEWTVAKGSMELLPDWVVLAAVASGQPGLMVAVLTRRWHDSGRLQHPVRPVLAHGRDYARAWVRLMADVVSAQTRQGRAALTAWVQEEAAWVPAMLAVLGPQCPACVRTILEQVPAVTPTGPTTLGAGSAKIITTRQQLQQQQTTTAAEPMELDNTASAKEETVWRDVLASGASLEAVGRALDRVRQQPGLRRVAHAELRELLRRPEAGLQKEAVRVLLGADYRVMPLLWRVLRSDDDEAEDGDDSGEMPALRSYPHVAKTVLWRLTNKMLLQQVHQYHAVVDLFSGGVSNSSSNSGDERQPFIPNLVETVCRWHLLEDGPALPALDQLGMMGVCGCGDLVRCKQHSVAPLLHLLVGGRPGPVASTLFCSQLLHDTEPTSLRRLLHLLLLADHHSADQASSPRRLLDLVAAIIYRLARFSSVQHPRQPQLSPTHPVRLGPVQIGRVLRLILDEAHLTGEEEPARSINRRCEQLLLACTAHPSLSLADKAAAFSHFLSENSHDQLVHLLGFSLYTIFPGLVDEQWRFRQDPSEWLELVLESDEKESHETVKEENVSVVGEVDDRLDGFQMLEMRRIGGRILDGLAASTDKAGLEISVQATRSLALAHEQLSVGLLPQMVALAEGAMEGLGLAIVATGGGGNSNAAEGRRKRWQTVLLSLAQMLEQCCHSKANQLDDVRALRHCLQQARQMGEQASGKSRSLAQFAAKMGLLLAQMAPSDSDGATMDKAPQARTTQLEVLLNYRFKQAPGGNGAGSGADHLIAEIDDAGRRDPSCTGLLLHELRRLVHIQAGSSAQQQQQHMTLLRVLVRHLTQFPQHAAHFFRNELDAAVSLAGGSSYWARPLSAVASSVLCQAVMLCPGEAPRSLCGLSRLLVAGRCSRRDMSWLLEEALDALSLESLIDCSLATVAADLVPSQPKSSGSRPRQHHQNGGSGAVSNRAPTGGTRKRTLHDTDAGCHNSGRLQNAASPQSSVAAVTPGQPRPKRLRTAL